MSAENNIQIFNEYSGALAPMRLKQSKYYNFYHNKQYSRSDRVKLRRMGLKPIVINIVRPLILQMISVLLSSKPTWKVVPLNGAVKEIADIAGKLLVGKWNSDYLDLELELVIKDMLISMAGYLFVENASFLDNSTFDVKIHRLNWKYVYPDPYCTKFDLSDAENIVLRKEVGAKYAQVLYNMSDEEMKEAIGSSNLETGRTDIIEVYSKYPVERISYSSSNDIDVSSLPPTVFYTSNIQNKIEDERRKWKEELLKLDNDGVIQVEKVRDLHVHKCISVGKLTKYEGIVNIRDYPIVPFTNEFSEEFNKQESEVTFIEGIQEGSNKFYMLTLHNALLTGNVRFMAPKGAIKNKTQFQKTWALPGAVNEWEPQPDLPNAGKPEVIQSSPLSSAFYGLASDLQRKAEFETAMFAPSQGNPTGTPETFSTTASLQHFASQRLNRLARRIDIQLAKVGEIVIQYLQNYTSVNEMIEFIDGNAHNADGSPNEDYGTVKSVGTVNQLEVDSSGGIKRFKNDARIGKFAVKVLTQPNLGTDRMNKASYMSNMVMNKALPPTTKVMETIFDFLEIPEYRSIVKELSESSANESKIKELINLIDVLKKQNEGLQKELVKVTEKNRDLELEDAIRKKLDVIKGNIEGAKKEVANEITKSMTQGE